MSGTYPKDMGMAFSTSKYMENLRKDYMYLGQTYIYLTSLSLSNVIGYDVFLMIDWYDCFPCFLFKSLFTYIMIEIIFDIDSVIKPVLVSW